MIDSTFNIIQDGNEYLILCDGFLDEKLYLFLIRTDKNGNWINDGRTLKDEIKSLNVDFKIIDLIYYPDDSIPLTFMITSTNGIQPYNYNWINPDTLVGEGPFTIDLSNNSIFYVEVKDADNNKVILHYEIRKDTIDRLKYDYRNDFIGLYNCEVIYSWVVDSNGIYIGRNYDIYQDTIEVIKHSDFQKINISNVVSDLNFSYRDSTFSGYHTSGKFKGDSIIFYFFATPAALYSWNYKGLKIK
jgi:hypothetical protein